MDLKIRQAELEDSQLIFDLRSDARLGGMQYQPAWGEYPELYVELSLAFAESSNPGFRCWTILLDGEFCGHISESLDAETSAGPIVSLGWNIVPEQWGKGIAPKAIGQFLTNKFRDDESIQFIAFCFESNSRCRRVLDKLGFLPEPPSFFEKLSNWFRTYGRHRLLKYRLTQNEWTANHPTDNKSLN